MYDYVALAIRIIPYYKYDLDLDPNIPIVPKHRNRDITMQSDIPQCRGFAFQQLHAYLRWHEIPCVRGPEYPADAILERDEDSPVEAP